MHPHRRASDSQFPRIAMIYVAGVIVAGASTLVALFPLAYPRPWLFAGLMLASCLTSAWKVNLPIPLASSSTLSVSYAADLIALLLLGPKPAVLIASAGAWTQCTFKVKRRYPAYRTVFSVAAEAITMAATGLAYVSLRGPLWPMTVNGLVGPLAAAMATYFVVNTSLIAGAIALSTGRSTWHVWRDDFLWSGASFMIAGSAGAVAAIVIARGDQWLAVFAIAPVYLTYRTYQLFVARLEDQQLHLAETRRLQQETVRALEETRLAERAVAMEKERLAQVVAEMTRIEEARGRLLEREQAARAHAEEASRMKDQFLALVSHELRTPLNAVLGWADMLRSGTISEERRNRACQAIYSNARRQAQLIDELLDVARIMSGKLRLERTPIDLNAIIQGAMEIVQPAADAKRIHLKFEGDPGIGQMLADGARLQQIVWNLVSNAVKFTPAAGQVLVTLQADGQAAEIAVSDSGEGIPADFLPSVFEPFRQADASMTRLHGGLGLGLSIVHHLVEAHGGTVKAESSGEGRGARFIVRLPIVPLAGETRHGLSIDALQPKDGTLVPVAALSGVSVLVVDDDDENREVVAAALENQRARVFTAASAAQAFDFLRHQRVDVLLADIAMPGEDGYSLIRRIRGSDKAETSSIPAVALTAFAREQDRQQALQCGFQLHLAKPVDARTLVAAVASLGRPQPIRS
jgi:signal transduction histidine kinase/CheY-like chemotaxis protein